MAEIEDISGCLHVKPHWKWEGYAYEETEWYKEGVKEGRFSLLNFVGFPLANFYRYEPSESSILTWLKEKAYTYVEKRGRKIYVRVENNDGTFNEVEFNAYNRDFDLIRLGDLNMGVILKTLIYTFDSKYGNPGSIRWKYRKEILTHLMYGFFDKSMAEYKCIYVNPENREKLTIYFGKEGYTGDKKNGNDHYNSHTCGEGYIPIEDLVKIFEEEYPKLIRISNITKYHGKRERK